MKIIKKVFILFLLLTGILFIQNVSALSVSVKIPEKYLEVAPSEKVYFEVEIKYPENPKRKDLRLEYEIKNNEGEIISQSKVLKAIETQASFVDFLEIPEDTKTGTYFINVKIKDYESLSEEVSSTFQIKQNKLNQLKTYFFTLLGSIFFVGILIIINIKKMNKKHRK